ncbi:SDR family NAD(P)-dependent oxidoreductase [Streptomyces flavidovirens]|uniref:SDR family NAD(P)-dependent oxidoreductase n=1 Tax=Streptomyces flavidovirens TaxID=67298 RepID=UPI00342B8688
MQPPERLELLDEVSQDSRVGQHHSSLLLLSLATKGGRPRWYPPLAAPCSRVGCGKLEGKVALITGGDLGIGRAVALLYAREGADVAIVHLPEECGDAEQVQREVRDQGRRCLLLPGDLAGQAFCREAVERTVAELGGRAQHPGQQRRLPEQQAGVGTAHR